MGRSCHVGLSIVIGSVIALGCGTMSPRAASRVEEGITQQNTRVRGLVSVLREEPGSADRLGTTKYLAAIELGEIGLEHPLPQEAMAALARTGEIGRINIVKLDNKGKNNRRIYLTLSNP